MRMITYEFTIPPEDCAKTLEKNIKITVNENGYTYEINIKMDESIMQHRNKERPVDGKSSTTCKNRGQVINYSYKKHMQKIKLKVNLETKQVQSPYGIRLPSTILEGGCKSTSLDPHVYTWDMSENCVVTKMVSQKAKMFKYADKLDNTQDHRLSERSEANGLDLKLAFTISSMKYAVGQQHCIKQILSHFLFHTQAVLT